MYFSFFTIIIIIWLAGCQFLDQRLNPGHGSEIIEILTSRPLGNSQTWLDSDRKPGAEIHGEREMVRFLSAEEKQCFFFLPPAAHLAPHPSCTGVQGKEKYTEKDSPLATGILMSPFFYEHSWHLIHWLFSFWMLFWGFGDPFPDQMLRISHL